MYHGGREQAGVEEQGRPIIECIRIGLYNPRIVHTPRHLLSSIGQVIFRQLRDGMVDVFLQGSGAGEHLDH